MFEFDTSLQRSPGRPSLLWARFVAGCRILLLTAIPIGAVAQDAAGRPNIVVFLCDDLGYGDLACYGHPHIQTPNLDRLAKYGIRFTDFYSAAPVCSPSRVGLLTGRSPNRAGVYDWIPAANRPRPDAREQVHLRKSEVTFPQLLQAAGYATCLSGKWHCNARFNQPTQAQPNDAGFDHWFATQNNAAPSHRNPENFVRNGESAGALEGYSCGLVVDEALSWLQSQVESEPSRPFFTFIAFHEPHEPVASPPELVEKYLNVTETREQAEYYANVHNVDLAVGRFLAGLERLGKSENTLVIFTSDNGPETLKRYPGAARSYGVPTPLRGMKLWTTEAGFRVAGIMRWPKRIEPGQTCSIPVSSLDFLPTFARLAQAEIPEDLVLDGTDFQPALTGREIARKKPLLWAYYNAINEHRVAMRDREWKVLAKLSLDRLQNVHDGNIDAIRNADLSEFQVYQVTDDIGESDNLAPTKPKLAQELAEKLKTQYRNLLNNSHIWPRPNQ